MSRDENYAENRVILKEFQTEYFSLKVCFDLYDKTEFSGAQIFVIKIDKSQRIQSIYDIQCPSEKILSKIF